MKIIITLGNKVYTVHFSSKEVKAEYITAEKYYCKEQLEEFYRAIRLKDRELAREQLAKKQLQFASQQNYVARTKSMPYELYLNQGYEDKRYA